MCAKQFFPLLILMSAVSGLQAQILDMRTAVTEAMLSSNQSKIADEKLVKSRAYENEQRGSLYPTVNFYATAGRAGSAYSTATTKAILSAYQDSSHDAIADALDDYEFASGNAYTYGMEVSGPIYTFGKLSTAIKSAELQDQAVRLNVQQTKRDLQLSVLDAYSTAVLAKAKVGVLRRSLQRAEETYTLLDRDFQAGKGMKSDVLVAKANLKALEPQILTAERDANTARQNLNRLLGRPYNDDAPLDSTGAFPNLEMDPVPTRDAALANAEKNRADLQALLVSADVYDNTSQIFRANYYPTIGYAGKFGFVAYEAEQLGQWVHRDWSVGVSLNWTLFDGLGKNAANHAQAAQWKSDARVFRFQAEELRRSVAIEIDGALQDRASAEISLQAALEGQAAAGEAVTILHANYPGSSTRLTDVLSGEDALRSAELSVLSARFNRTRALANLRLVQGFDLIPVLEEK
ncbi:MAG TPA: TolC family protein [Fibrobacteraceae bacterium]|nr:TolC family protein [Fibrobacteraceae bacterium]